MSKSAEEVIKGAIQHAAYDPAKAHEYYIRNRKLKGRERRAKVIPLKPKNKAAQPNHQIPANLQQQIDSIKARLSQLQGRLREIMQNKQETKKSDDTKTAAEKSKDARESKQYRDKHKTELAQKRKTSSSKSGGGGGKSSLSTMSEDEVRSAILSTRSKLKDAVAKARASANRSTA